MYVSDTIVAAATPAGMGAVAIVRLSGPRAIEIAGLIWRPQRRGDSSPAPPRTMVLGEIFSDAGIIDQTMCVTMPAPASFTGEDVVELHCHGGPYLVRRIIALAVQHGARIAEPGEFTRRAYLNGKLGLTEAEAIADLISARSENALRQAVSQLSGALSERVAKLRQPLIDIRAQVEAQIDFADEDIPLQSRTETARAIESVRSELTLLHDSFSRGRIAREGVQVAIIGK